MMSKWASALFFANLLAANGIRQVAVTLDGSEDAVLKVQHEDEATGKCPRYCGELHPSELPDANPGETYDQALQRVLDSRCTNPSYKACLKCTGNKKKGQWVPCCSPTVDECRGKRESNLKDKDTPVDTNKPGNNNGDKIPADTIKPGNNGVEDHVDCSDYDNLYKDAGECFDEKAGPVASKCCDDLDENEDVPEELPDPKTTQIDERVSEGGALDNDEDVVEELPLTPAQKACSGFQELDAAFETAAEGSRQFTRSLINEKALAKNKAAQDAKALQDLFDVFAEKSKAPKGKFGKANCDLSQSTYGKKFKLNGKSTGYYEEGKGYKKASHLIGELASCCEGPGKVETQNTGSGSGSGSPQELLIDESGSGSGSGSSEDVIADDRQGEVLEEDNDEDDVEELTPASTPAKVACSGIGKVSAAFNKAKQGTGQYQRSIINEKALAANQAAQDAKALQDLLDEFAVNSKAPKGKFGKANCDLSQSTFGKKTKASGKSTGYYDEGKGYKKAAKLVSDLETCCEDVVGIGDA